MTFGQPQSGGTPDGPDTSASPGVPFDSSRFPEPAAPEAPGPATPEAPGPISPESGEPGPIAGAASVAPSSASVVPDPLAGGGGSGPTGRRPGRPGRPPRLRRSGRPKLTFFQELPFLVVAALVLAIIIKAFIVQAFYIPSGSMEKTLHGSQTGGDRVMVNKLVYRFKDIRRGDIVVFEGSKIYNEPVSTDKGGNVAVRGLRKVGEWVGLAPQGTDYIKRVIGLPGDRVTCCDAKGRLSVNGIPLDESYTFGDTSEFDVTVPPDRLWVMGDHRNESQDSRFVGAIPKKNVVGRAFAIIWPPSRWRWLPTPKVFDNVPATTTGGNALPTVSAGLVVFGLYGVRRRRRRRRA